MVAPLLIAGARVVGGAARAGAKTAGRSVARGGRSSGRRGVTNARALGRSNRRGDTRSRARTAETVDEMRVREQGAAENNSVTRSAEIRKSRREREYQYEPEDESTEAIKRDARRHLLRPEKARRERLKRMMAGEGPQRAFRVARFRMMYIMIMHAYVIFLFFWLLQIMGVALAAGLAETVDWIPFFGDKLVDGALLLGLLTLCISWLIGMAILVPIHSYLIFTKKLSADKAIIWLALSCVPLAHITSLGIWFTRGKAPK